MDRTITKSSLRVIQVEALIQRHYDPQKLHLWFDSCQHNPPDRLLYPYDAPTTVKLITGGIKRLQKEFEALYRNNYRELKDLIASLKNTIPDLNEEQLAKTNTELDKLYNDSKQADVINLNITQVDERMNTVCRLLNVSR
jgi:hypothetical protein